MVTDYNADLDLKAAKISYIKDVIAAAVEVGEKLESEVEIMRTLEAVAKENGDRRHEIDFEGIRAILSKIIREFTAIVDLLTPFYESVSKRLGRSGSLEARSTDRLRDSVYTFRSIYRHIEELVPYLHRDLRWILVRDLNFLYDQLKSAQSGIFFYSL